MKVNELEEKQRFVETAESATILSIPQCVECKYNEGQLLCAKLSSKPMSYVLNEEECPMKNSK